MVLLTDSPENTGNKNTAARQLLPAAESQLCFSPIIGAACMHLKYKHCKFSSWRISKNKVSNFPRTASFIWKWNVPVSLFIVGTVCMNEPLQTWQQNQWRPKPNVCTIYNNSRHWADALPRVTCNKCNSEHSSSSTRFVLDNPRPNTHTDSVISHF